MLFRNKRYGLLLLLILFTGLSIKAQVITHFSKSYIIPGDTFVINGKGFSANASDYIVLFGSVQSKVIKADTASLKTIVPLGLHSNKISVFDKNKIKRINTSLKVYSSISSPFDSTFTRSSFSSKINILESQYISESKYVDLNNDGMLDIVYSSQYLDKLGFLVNKGGMQFDTVSINIPKNVLFMYIADLNNDALSDIILTTWDSIFYIYRNTSKNGKFSFANATKFLRPSNYQEMQFEDINADGRTDILISNYYEKYSIYFNTTKLDSVIKFSKKDYFFPKQYLNFAFKDINLDGRSEFLFTDRGTDSLWLCQNDTKGDTFIVKAANSYKLKRQDANNCDWYDINNDGKNEIVVGHLYNGDTLSAYQVIDTSSLKINSKGKHYSPAKYPLIPYFMNDLDGDRQMDFIGYSGRTDSLSILLNNSDTAGLKFKPVYLGKFNNNQNMSDLGDVNNDGLMDILSIGNYSLNVFLGCHINVNVLEKHMDFYLDSLSSSISRYVHIVNCGETQLSLDKIINHQAFTYTLKNDSSIKFPVNVKRGDTLLLKVTFNSSTKKTVSDTVAFIFNRNIVYKNSVFRGFYTIPIIKLDSVSKRKIIVGDTLLIYGRHFGTIKSDILVKIGNLPCKVIEVSENKIKAMIPTYYEYQKLSITHVPTHRTVNTGFEMHPVFKGAESAIFNSKSYTLSDSKAINPLAVSYFNRDSLPDIVSLVVNSTQYGKFLSPYINTSQPRQPFFKESGLSKQIDTNIAQVFITELDHDGMMDYICVNQQDKRIRFFVNSPSKSDSILFNLELKYTYKINKDYRETVVSDLDGDGKADILISYYDSTLFCISSDFNKNSLDYNIDQEVILDKRYKTLGLLRTADLNQDNLPELLGVNPQDSTILIFKNISKPGFVEFSKPVIIKTRRIYEITVSSLNNDNLPDIIYTDDDSSKITILANESSGDSIRFTKKNTTPLLKGSFSHTCDVNGDGLSDIFITVSNLWSVNSVLCQKMNDTLWKYNLVKYNFPKVVLSFDMDGKKQPDIACTNGTVYRNISAEASFTNNHQALFVTDTFGKKTTEVVWLKNPSNTTIFISEIETAKPFSVADSSGSNLNYPIRVDSGALYKIYVTYSPVFPARKTIGNLKVSFSQFVYPIEKVLEGRVKLAPLIDSIKPLVALPGDTMWIYGKHFDTSAQNANLVNFGSLKAEIISIKVNLIRVTIPVGAPNDFIQVVDTINNLCGISGKTFMQKCLCRDKPLTLSSFNPEQIIPINNNPIVLLKGVELNKDGKIDLISTVIVKQTPGYTSEIDGIRNMSTVRKIRLVDYAMAAGGGDHGAGSDLPLTFDINGDGNMDLTWIYYAAYGSWPRPPELLYFLEQKSFTKDTISYGVGISKYTHYNYLNYSSSFTGHDFNRDGIFDLNLGNDGDSAILYSYSRPYYNTFQNYTENLPIRRLAKRITKPTNGYFIMDMDSDGKSDLTTTFGSALYIARNLSKNETFAFDSSRIISKNVNWIIQMANMNSDEKPDILASYSSDTIIVFLNNSTPGNLKFTVSKVKIGPYILGRPFTVADFTGDGKPDLAAIKSDKYGKDKDTIYVFRNISTSGIAFDKPIKLKTNKVASCITNADIDGDLRPDIILGYSNSTNTKGFIGVFRNSCIDGYLSRDTFTFSGSKSGYVRTEYTTLYSSGNDTFKVSAINLPGSGYKVFNLSTGTKDSSLKAPLTMAPGTSIKLKIVFSPDTLKSYNDSVIFTNNAFKYPLTIKLNAKNMPWAIADIHPDTLLFGTLNFKDSSSQKFIIKNKGYDTLRVSKIKLDDSISFNIKKGYGTKIKPGDSSIVVIKFNPKVAKIFEINCTVIHNAVGSPKKGILKGKGIGPGAVDSSNLNFGKRSINNLYRDSVAFTNTGNDTLFTTKYIYKSVKGLYWIDSSTSKPPYILPSQVWFLKFAFKPDSVLNYKSTITIEHNGLNKSSKINITGTGLGSYISFTNRLDFDKLRINKNKTKTIKIKAKGNDSLKVSKIVWSSGKEFKWNSPTMPFKLKALDSITVNLGFTPLSVGHKQDTVWIYSNAQGSPHYLVTLGTGVNPATNDSLKLDFGLRDIRKTFRDSIYFKNFGTDTLHISKYIKSAPKQFVWLDSIKTKNSFLAPNDSIKIVFSIKADSTLLYKGSLKILHDGSSAYSYVSILGTGKAAYGKTVNLIDFGKARMRKKTISKQVLTNFGNDTLKLIQCKVKIGSYFNLEWPKSIKSIAPNDTANLVISFLPTAPFLYLDSLLITSNSSNKIKNLLIKGTGVEPNVVDSLFIDFGTIVLKDSVKKNAILTNTGTDTLFISSFRWDKINQMTWIDSNASKIKSIAPGKKATFTFSFLPDILGTFKTFFKVFHDAQNKQTTISIKGMCKASLLKTDTLLDFGLVKENKTNSGKLRIYNIGNKSCKINSLSFLTGVEFSWNGSVPFNIAPDDSALLTIYFKPTNELKYTDQIIINSDAINPVLKIQLNGEGKKSKIQTDSSLDFINVKYNNFKLGEIDLHSVGSDTLTIDSVSFKNGTYFKINKLFSLQNIAPGRSWQLGLECIPNKRKGLLTDSVYIYHNADNSPLVISLRASSVFPEVNSNRYLVDFDKVKYNGRKLESLDLKSSGTDTLTLDSVNFKRGGYFKLNDPFFAVNLGPGITKSIELICIPSNIKGELTDTLFIFQNTDISPLIVSLKAISISPKVLTTKENINFGKVETNKKALDKLFIKNIGDDSAVIFEQNNRLNSIFDATPKLNNYFLRPGDSVLLEISFSPIAISYYDDTIYFKNNSLDSIISVKLNGEGIDKVGIINKDNSPKSFKCIPNPASKTLEIIYNIQSNTKTTFSIYDNVGKYIRLLKGTEHGQNTVSFETDISDLATGLYYVHLKSGYVSQVQILLIER